MDAGGSIQSNERAAEKVMDDYLKSIGLHRKKIAKDGSCLFRAVAEQVLHCQSHHSVVRAKCVEFLKDNRKLYEAFVEGDFEEYLFKLQDPQQWVGEVEINALAIMYKRDFLIFQEPGKPAVNITDNNFKDKVQLCFMNGNHYDSVYPISHVRNAGMCQSILYELLYDRVFKVDQGLLGLCQRVTRPAEALSDDSMPFCGSSEESDLDTSEALWVESETTTTTTTKHGKGRGRRGPQLPERVRRSLNPMLYRNIEYDVWHKTKKAQQKMDYCIAAGMQFAVGDQCQVRLDGSGRSYSATVKEVPPDNGPVTVLIEELGRKQVPLWNLRPASDKSSWRTVGGRDKKLSNGLGEWEERGKGRGRGKHIPGSSSASQAAAGGSSGRGQKLHVWPSQSPKEEQGGGKSSRRPVSSVEPAFGLTEEQRLAREEEEINVALVEIQLRDEHSFPALGTQPRAQNEAGRRKGGEKFKFARNKMSPIEDNRVPSPAEGKNPKSSTPPLAGTPTVTSAPNTNAGPGSPSAPAAQCPAPTDSAAKAAPEPPLASASTAAKTKPFSNVKAVAPCLPPAGTQSVTPPVPGVGATTSPHLSTSSPPSSLPLKMSSSPSPSSVPAPTFIAPVAPSPTAHGFLPPASLPRCSPTPHSLQRPLSPHPSSSSVQTTPSASVVRHADRVHEAPPITAQSPIAGAAPVASPTIQTQAAKPEFLPQGPVQTLVEKCSQAAVPGDQPLPAQTQATVCESPLPHMQHGPQSHPEVDTAPQIPPPVSAQASQPDVAQVQDFHLALGDVDPPAQLNQPPHPSQVPSPSFPLPDAPDAPHSQNSSTRAEAEESLPPTQPQPESPTPPAFQPQQPHTSHHPHLATLLPHFQSIPGGVPLHQLSQLYQDPLYPGFPQCEKGGVAVTPPYSSNKSGDDMPQDINILRFFFNLGIKAYSMPMFAPYIYLFPLQHAHTMQAHSQSPAPNYPPSTPPARTQELYPPPQYPPASSMPAQYDHPAATESSQVGEVFNQPTYPITDALPQRTSGPTHAWELHQIPPPAGSSFAVGYPTANQPYPPPRHFPQGYHPVSGPQQYPAGAPPYTPSSLGYQSPPAHEELQGNQGPPEQQQQQPQSQSQPQPQPQQQQQQHNTNGESSPHVHGTIAAKMANISSSRTMMLPAYPLKIEARENLAGAVLLVDPPLNNTPILVSNSGVKDVPISRTTMNPNSTPGSPLSYEICKTPALADNNRSHGYRGHPKMVSTANNYSSPGTSETGQVGYLASMAEPMSVGCSTEEDWEEKDFKPAPSHYRPRRTFRGGGRWRGSHDSGRGANRRRQGDMGVAMNYFHYSPSPRGRGRERGY